MSVEERNGERTEGPARVQEGREGVRPSGRVGADSQTIDLRSLFSPDLTVSGSFDLRRIRFRAFETLLQALSVPTLLVTRSHAIEFTNKAFMKIASNLDPLGLDFADLFSSSNLDPLSLLEEVITSPKSQFLETELRLGSNTVWARVHLQTIRLGTELRILVQLENLSAEKELLAIEKYKKLLNMFPIGLAEFSLTRPVPRDTPVDPLCDRILEAGLVDGNAEFARMHGYRSAQDLADVSLSKLLPTGGKGRALFEKWIRDDFPFFSFERKERCSTGPAKHFDNSLMANSNEHELLGLWWLKRDISEKKRMDQEIQKAQKLESLGVLAGGIAHDFNNLLTGILGNISLGLTYTKQSGKSQERFQAAVRAAQRAQDLTNQLLTFSKGGAPIKRTSSLAELLKDCASFILSGSKVRCKFAIAEGLWAVEMDDGQISQVINNLLLNAVDSMPSGGAVLIRTENVVISGLEGLPLDPGRYVKASITDRGCGMRKEIVGRIFDPYFTTKKKGSGLGLSTTYFIIKKHGGSITVRSKLGIGTVFHFFLPASPSTFVPKDETEKLWVRGRGSILLMDDEEVIRELGEETLSILGYEVTLARTGDEAIEICKDRAALGQCFDAAILDLTVAGGMGGEKAIQKILGIDPNLKVIASSGYANSIVMSDPVRYGFKGILPKPYDAEKLVETLAGVLAQDSAQDQGASENSPPS
jgi:two-component system, cell cycle sensor histidine kinase and response regulator CckA